MEDIKKYTVSVIIPNYNKSRFLRQCIQSVLDQSLQPDEIIVVDDCSTDKSADVISTLCQGHEIIKPIYLSKNGGVSHARNVGLEAAQSEYVTFLDSDDFYGNTDKLKKEMNLIREHGEQDIIAYSKLRFANEEGEFLDNMEREDKYYLTGNIWKRMVLGQFEVLAIARDYCVKKSIVQEIGGYNETRSLYEDLELLIKLTERLCCYCTYDFGSVYRQSPNGLSKKSRVEHRRERNSIVHERIQHLGVFKRMIMIGQWKIETAKYYISDSCYKIYCSMMHVKEQLRK